MVKKRRNNTIYLTEDEKVLIKRGVETDQGQNVITSLISLADEDRRIILSGSNEDKKKQLMQGLDFDLDKMEDAVEGVGSEIAITLSGELSQEDVYNKLMSVDLKRLEKALTSGKDIAPQGMSREEKRLFLCGGYRNTENDEEIMNKTKLVLYKTGNRKQKEEVYGKDCYLLNVKFDKDCSSILGMYFNEIYKEADVELSENVDNFVMSRIKQELDLSFDSSTSDTDRVISLVVTDK